MWKRQPDGAELLPARRDAVENAARDDQMAARIVVAEREAEPMVEERDERAAERSEYGHGERQRSTPR